MKNYKFAEYIKRWKDGEKLFLVSDGAMGTTLQKHGFQSGTCPEEWNISHPEILKNIYKEYYDAGSDFVSTNTFGGNRILLKKYGYENKVSEFNKAAIELAKSVCPVGKFVAGSVGPTGELLDPLGTLTFDDAKNIFREQITSMVEADVDLVIIETMMDVNEAKAAVEAVKEIENNLPIIATMTFEKSAYGYNTMMGVSPKNAIDVLSNAGADVLGANCGKGLDEMIDIMREFRKHTSLPLIAQANAGLPQIVDGKIVYTETPEERAEGTKQLMEIKINIIGGCCGTTYEHIKAIRDVVNNYKY